MPRCNADLCLRRAVQRVYSEVIKTSSAFMRSADFRAGLIRVAALGRKVFPVPEISPSIHAANANRWRLVAASAAVLALLIAGAWYAGRESAGLDAQRFGAELNALSQQVASTQLALQQEKARTDELQKALASAGKTAALALESELRQQLSRAQAEANTYKQIIEREREAAVDDLRLLDALSHPGAHLLPLKGSEAAADSTAYALLVQNSRLLLVASHLPKLEENHQFQVWVVRKEDPKVVSAGVFTPDNGDRAFMSYDDGSILSEIAQVEVTEEPQGGSSAPTGTKLLESAASAEPARSVSGETARPTEASLRVGSLSRCPRPDISRSPAYRATGPIPYRGRKSLFASPRPRLLPRG